MINRHIISSSASIFEALKALNNLSGHPLTLFALDADGLLVGSLTDGDIRRALLRGVSTQDSLSEALRKDFHFIDEEMKPEEKQEAFAKARKIGIRLLPILKEGRITNILDLSSTKAMLPVDAVLMAGGRGERLRPLTLSRPKPLLPIGGKAIIDYNVDELALCGVNNIFVTVNYLKEQIEAHFRDKASSATIRCVAEPKRLGTMGSLSLVAPMLKQEHLIVMNSDLLTTLDFTAMYRRHIDTGADLTIAATPYIVSVPYAILNTDGDRVKGLEEKPTFNYLANAGVYIMRRSLVDRIPADTYVDAPDFIDSLISGGMNVGFFPIDGTWIDIGSPEDYKYADSLMSRPIT